MAKTNNDSADRKKLRNDGPYSGVDMETVADHPGQVEHDIDRLLDEALEQTFPASDAITLVFGRSR